MIKLSNVASLRGGLSGGNYGHRVEIAERDPSQDDYNFYLGTLWICGDNIWMLVKVQESKATWYKIVTPEFTDVYEVVGNILATFDETQQKAQDALDTANTVKEAKENGELDGFDPIVEVTEQNGGALLTVTDATHTTSAVIEKGNKGDSGTLSIGEVRTGVAGSEVIITNSGTPEAAVLNITIPRGQQGFGLTISGKYASYDEFIAAHPTGTDGENWQVVTDDGDVVYTWNAVTEEWQNLGELRGADGPYFAPLVQDGVISWTNNGDLPNPESYDLLADTKDFILEQGYADSAEIQRLINNTLYQSIQASY